MPKWQQGASLIGNNPGLGFRPLPPGDNVESTLIWYKTSDPKNYESWTRELDVFLEREYGLPRKVGEGAVLGRQRAREACTRAAYLPGAPVSPRRPRSRF